MPWPGMVINRQRLIHTVHGAVISKLLPYPQMVPALPPWQYWNMKPAQTIIILPGSTWAMAGSHWHTLTQLVMAISEPFTYHLMVPPSQTCTPFTIILLVFMAVTIPWSRWMRIPLHWPIRAQAVTVTFQPSPFIPGSPSNHHLRWHPITVRLR